MDAHSPRKRTSAQAPWRRELAELFDRDLAADALAAVVGAFALGWLGSQAVFLGAFLGGTTSRVVRILVRRWKTRTIWGVSGVLGLSDIWHLLRARSHTASAAEGHAGGSAAAQGAAVLAASACAAGAVTAAQPILPDPLRAGDGTPASRAGFATPGPAIAATAREERWAERIEMTFTGRCPQGFTGGLIGVLCWFPDRDPPPPARAQLELGERLFTVGGFSNHEEIWLALERSAGRWQVSRILSPPELPEDTGPITQP